MPSVVGSKSCLDLMQPNKWFSPIFLGQGNKGLALFYLKQLGFCDLFAIEMACY